MDTPDTMELATILVKFAKTLTHDQLQLYAAMGIAQSALMSDHLAVPPPPSVEPSAP